MVQGDPSLREVPTPRRLIANLITVGALMAGLVFALQLALPEPLELIADVLGIAGAISLSWAVVARRLHALVVQEARRSTSVISHAMDAIVTLDGQGRVRSFNRAAERMFGYRSADIIGQGIGPIIPEPSFTEYCARIVDGLDQTLEAGTLRLAARHKRGSAIVVEGNFSAYVYGGERLINGVLRDVTERERVEEALRTSEESFRTLFEHLPDAVVVQGTNGKISLANRAACELFACEAHPPTGRPSDPGRHAAERGLRTLLGSEVAGYLPKDGARLAELTREARDTSEPRALGEVELARLDGNVASVEVKLVPLTLHAERVVAVIVRDVTETKRMQAQLILADRMAAMGTLAAGVAHEINNPLCYVIGNLGFVSEGLKGLAEARPGEVSAGTISSGKRSELEELRGLVVESLDGGRRIARIVRDLAGYSRTTADESRPVELEPVLETSIKMAANQIKARALLVTDVPPTLPRVVGDPGRIGQVFLNLLINAAQATPEGHADENEVRVSAKSHEGMVVVEVRDTGAGIPEHIQQRIFDPFFTTKPIGGGTGLGLTISHAIVTALGGRIEVESEVGRGTTFRVSLPAVKDAAPAVAKTREGRVARGKSLRVLAVDDEVPITRMIARALGGEHEVSIATDGRKALELIEGDTFDVILCDLMMPAMSGAELYEALERTHPDLLDRLIFVTGGSFTEASRRFLDRVSNPCIEKPFDVPTLRRLVRSVSEDAAETPKREPPRESAAELSRPQ